MNRKKVIVIVGSIGALSVAWYFMSLRKRPVQHTAAELVSIVGSAGSVEAFRLKGRPGFLEERIGDFKVVGRGRNPDAATRKALKAFVVAQLNLPAPNFDGKKCSPQPAVAFRFESGGNSVDAVVCFECADLRLADEVYPKNPDFEKRRDTLLKLTKPLFPGDAEIQNVPYWDDQR